MTNINQQRMDYLQSYYDNQLVLIEVPAVISHTNKGKVIYRFSGVRNGYRFHEGFCKVSKKDVHLFEYQHYIIHTEEKGNK